MAGGAGGEVKGCLLLRILGVLVVVLTTLLGCSGSSRNVLPVSSGADPCQAADAGKANEDPARQFLEIEMCPAQGRQRVKGDSR